MGRRATGGDRCVGLRDSWCANECVLAGLKEAVREFLSTPKGGTGSELFGRFVEYGTEGLECGEFGLVAGWLFHQLPMEGAVVQYPSCGSFLN